MFQTPVMPCLLSVAIRAHPWLSPSSLSPLATLATWRFTAEESHAEGAEASRGHREEKTGHRGETGKAVSGPVRLMCPIRPTRLMPGASVAAAGASPALECGGTTPPWLARIPREMRATVRRRRDDGEKRKRRTVIGKMIRGKMMGAE